MANEDELNITSRNEMSAVRRKRAVLKAIVALNYTLRRSFYCLWSRPGILADIDGRSLPRCVSDAQRGLAEGRGVATSGLTLLPFI